MPLLCPTAAKAINAPVETTLRQLLDEYELDHGAGVLASLVKLETNLAAFELDCTPPVGTQGLDDIRIIKFCGKSSLDHALEIIGAGETSQVEFKSSLLFDWKRFRNQPNANASDCKLNNLIHSSLKTIAAFANTEGGTLIVGVEDNLEICGLEHDYNVVDPNRRNYDGWEQFFRNQVDSKFVDGKAVNSYVRSEEVFSDGKPFVKIQVAARNDLTFLKNSDGFCQLFHRSGTRSISVDFEEIEKHYSVSRKF